MKRPACEKKTLYLDPTLNVYISFFLQKKCWKSLQPFLVLKKKNKVQTIRTPGNSSEESFQEETYSWERLTHWVVQVEHDVHFGRVPEHICQGLSFINFMCLKFMNSMINVYFDILDFSDFFFS